MGTNSIPPFDPKLYGKGFITRLLTNLPKPFNPSPKLETAITVTVKGSYYDRLSIVDGKIQAHRGPYDSPTYSTTLDLSNYHISELSDLFNGGSDLGSFEAYYPPELGNMLSTNLVPFKDFPFVPGQTIELQYSTSQLHTYLAPIAKMLESVEQDTATAENQMYMPFSTGFWLDFWGDWLDIPRPPQLFEDKYYVAYMLNTLRLPKANNMAIEDILTAKYGVSAKVEDSGYKQFTVTLDASAMSLSAADIAALVNRVKLAGVRWLLTYASNNIENYKSYFYDRQKGVEFKNSDVLGTTVEHAEARYGYDPTDGFMFGESTFNNDHVGGASKVRDKFTMYYS